MNMDFLTKWSVIDTMTNVYLNLLYITNPISSKENHFQLFRLHIIFYFTLTSILHHPAAMMHLSRHDIIHSFQVFLHTTKSKLNDEICRREIEI